MTDLAKLKHFMSPYYQEDVDEALLNDYLTDYKYPECAASKLWYELKGKLALGMDGLRKIATGAEKFEYVEPTTLQAACDKNGKYYEEQCAALKYEGSMAIRVAKTTIGGITEEYGTSS